MAANKPHDVTYYKDTVQREKLLICGHSRSIEHKLRNSSVIPMAINKMILHFYLFIQFKFDRESPCFDVNEDKLSVTLKKHEYGAIQFGEFFTPSDKVKYSVTFLMADVNSENVTFGFITPAFNQWDNSKKWYDANNVILFQDWNPIDIVKVLLDQFPQIETWLISMNYYEMTTTSKAGAAKLLLGIIESQPQFETLIKLIPQQIKSIDKNFYNDKHFKIITDTLQNKADSDIAKWFETGDKVTVEIDTFRMKGKISCQKKKGDKYIMDGYEFETDLPNKVGIIVYGGLFESKIKVLDQQFSYYRPRNANNNCKKIK